MNFDSRDKAQAGATAVCPMNTEEKGRSEYAKPAVAGFA
jgi:hypothetical protein